MKKIPIESNRIYYVTQDGKVYNQNKIEMKQRTNKLGYKQINLTVAKNKLKTFLVHRLVAITYIDNPENKAEVNHINGIKTDNRIENLEWVTHSENQKHAYATGLQVSTDKQKAAISIIGAITAIKYKSRAVINISTGNKYYSTHEASRQTGISQTTISKHARGIVKNPQWQYKKK
jgi:hypothetical protein